jgi:hypothetical protein
MENSIDKLTLELLINKQHYSKYLSKTDPKKHDEYKEYKSKLRKYSVDIVDITSQLIDNPKTMFSAEIEETFDAYVKSIFKYFEIKELEKSNEYNYDNNNNKNEDEDVLFGNCDNNLLQNAGQRQESAQETENEEHREEQEGSPMMKSFWGKEKVIKKSSTIPHYDMNMFHKKR